MHLEDVVISRAIIETYSRELLDALESDVAVVGGGRKGPLRRRSTW